MLTMNHQPQGSFAPDLSVFTNYEYEADVDGNNALAYVLELNGSNKKVLEVGAGSGMMTKHLVKVKGCDVVGLEINPASIEKLRSYIDRIYSLDLNNPSWTGEVAREGKFDTIIAADVLEHLYDPWTVLKGMKPLLNDTGSVIISLPHVAHSAVISRKTSNIATGDCSIRRIFVFLVSTISMHCMQTRVWPLLMHGSSYVCQRKPNLQTDGRGSRQA